MIPAGPGDNAWQGLLPQLGSISAREIVLVRTGLDAPLTASLPEKVREIRSVTGRARQLNAGAAASTGDWLWFLHADSRLTPQCPEALTRFIAMDRDTIGYFDLRFLGDGPALTGINTFGTWWRTRLFGMPFGDQGFLMSRRVFDALGGFDECLPSAEDHALVWTARRANVPVKSVGAFLYTSARKYAQQGWWKTTRQHLALTWKQARTFSRGDVN